VEPGETSEGSLTRTPAALSIARKNAQRSAKATSMTSNVATDRPTDVGLRTLVVGSLRACLSLIQLTLRASIMTLAPLDGLEPPTQHLGRARSIQLSYRGTSGSIGPALPLVKAAQGRYTLRVTHSGAWLSLVERTVRDREVGGSNPLAPTPNMLTTHWHGRTIHLVALQSIGRATGLCGFDRVVPCPAVPPEPPAAASYGVAEEYAAC